MTVQVPIPEQVPPLHPTNVEFALGVAVSVMSQGPVPEQTWDQPVKADSPGLLGITSIPEQSLGGIRLGIPSTPGQVIVPAPFPEVITSSIKNLFRNVGKFNPNGSR
jgi:hypothetical protein